LLSIQNIGTLAELQYSGISTKIPDSSDCSNQYQNIRILH